MFDVNPSNNLGFAIMRVLEVRRKVMAFVKDSLSDQDKEMIIAQALDTDEGRVALAQAMVEPIRRSLEYQAINYGLIG
tara:strand:- start:56 stop:289 length:234 start_codon:yes stop_codon:yes gene_type:complete